MTEMNDNNTTHAKMQPNSRFNAQIMLSNNLILQQYEDAKSRIGKHKCPYCQEGNVEFDDDTTVLFIVFKKIEVFNPNRLVVYEDDDTLNYANAELFQICLCTAEVYCKKCGIAIPIYSYDRHIDQMQEIIDHLKLKEIDIPMSRPRNRKGGPRELITYFRIDYWSIADKYAEDLDDVGKVINGKDKDNLSKEYTEYGIHKSKLTPMTAEKSFLNRYLDHTYTRRE
jgi:hypothetical protein